MRNSETWSDVNAIRARTRIGEYLSGDATANGNYVTTFIELLQLEFYEMWIQSMTYGSFLRASLSKSAARN